MRKVFMSSRKFAGLEGPQIAERTPTMQFYLTHYLSPNPKIELQFASNLKIVKFCAGAAKA